MTSKNALARYLAAHGGPSAKRTLQALVLRRAHRTIRWATLHDIAEGRVRASAETARALHRATDGEIDAAELLGLTSGRESAA